MHDGVGGTDDAGRTAGPAREHGAASAQPGEPAPATGHGHGHGHGHGGKEPDWDLVGDYLENEGELALGALEAAGGWLAELAGTHPVQRVMDLGAGPGVAACVLAGAFPDAEVTAVDGSAPLLARASARAGRLGLGERFAVRQCDLLDGLDTLPAADLVWASRVVHHLPDQGEALRRIGTLLRPGGLLAVVEGGLPRRTLPRDIGIGRPGLEARVGAAMQDWFAELRVEVGEKRSTVEHWPRMLAEAGLVPARSRSFLIDVPAPLDPAVRATVADWWQSILDRLEDRLAADDRATVRRLLDRNDPDGLLNRPDVFVLTADTVHVGRAPAG